MLSDWEAFLNLRFSSSCNALRFQSYNNMNTYTKIPIGQKIKLNFNLLVYRLKKHMRTFFFE